MRPQVPVLLADVQDAARRTDDVAAQGHPFEDHVGVAGEQDAILERPRLTFIGVAHHVALGGRDVAACLPLDGRLETGASAPAQVRAIELLERLVGAAPPRVSRRRVHRLLVLDVLERLVAAAQHRRFQRGAGLRRPTEHHIGAAEVVLHAEVLGRPLLYRSARVDELGDLIHAHARQVGERQPVHQGRGALVAQPGARGEMHGGASVGARLAELDAEPVAEIGGESIAPLHAVGDVVADVDDVLAEVRVAQERIEADHASDVSARDAQVIGHQRHRLGRNEVQRVLHLDEDLQQLAQIALVRLEDLAHGIHGGMRFFAHHVPLPGLAANGTRT